MGVIIKLFHREKLKGIGPDSTLIEELQGIAMTEGSNQVTSLANLRYIVGSLSNDTELYSGRQQDGVEFITLLLQNLPTNVNEMFDFTENVCYKFILYNRPSACPLCNRMPNDKLDVQNMLQLYVPDTEIPLKLTDILNRHYAVETNNASKRCSR